MTMKLLRRSAEPRGELSPYLAASLQSLDNREPSLLHMAVRSSGSLRQFLHDAGVAQCVSSTAASRRCCACSVRRT